MTTSQLPLSGGTLRAQRGNPFYVDVVDTSTVVRNATLAVDVPQGNLLLTSSGAKSNLSAYDEVMEGHLVSEEGASVVIYFCDVTKLIGNIRPTPGPGKAKAPGTALYIDGTSIWAVNGNSMLHVLHTKGLMKDGERFDVTTQGKGGTICRKEKSVYTMTVTGRYRANADFRGVGIADEFSTHVAE